MDTPTKLSLLSQASPETKELVAAAWDQGVAHGLGQAPIFNYKSKAISKLQLPRARWWIQNLIAAPGWFIYVITSPIWLLLFQLPSFVWQAGTWAQDDPFSCSHRDSWFVSPWNPKNNCYFTYWLEQTFPKE